VEQRPLWIAAQARAIEIGSKVFLKAVMARHRVPLPLFSRSRTQSQRFCV
jgi:hypothetical protein